MANNKKPNTAIGDAILALSKNLKQGGTYHFAILPDGSVLYTGAASGRSLGENVVYMEVSLG